MKPSLINLLSRHNIIARSHPTIKKFKYSRMKPVIFYSAVVLVALASCTKVLDTNSPSDFTSALVFSNTTEAQKAVSGVYALFNQDAFTSRVSNNFTGNSDIECGGV